jgi:thiol-disulfide isomerase/thioredoxin
MDAGQSASRLACLVLALAPLLGASAGEPLALEDARGAAVALAPEPGERALVAHFWATWCPECVKELPTLERLAPRCAPHGVRIVAVNVGESLEAIERFRAEHGIALPMLRDPKGRAWRSLAARGLPANLVWTGGVRRVEVGPRDDAAWARTLAELGCSEGEPAR